MNTLVTTTLHPQTAASASAVVVRVEQPQTTSKQGFNVVQQNQTPVVQLMTHLPQQAPQVIEDDNTPVKGMFLGFARPGSIIGYHISVSKRLISGFSPVSFILPKMVCQLSKILTLFVCS